MRCFFYVEGTNAVMSFGRCKHKSDTACKIFLEGTNAAVAKAGRRYSPDVPFS